ncbi:hypothetical protein BDN71DRAFT_1384028 [Pleurotus eryngii]|uniref:CCZ1/INTU/HSP4 first Longin domain-containing protein n=1 Tax=Pleurotus eryngii TaxID=5323 RepID=A0A9P6A3Q1_PLEER|nr:hypothetical protein BDN71DRAFT_1384028 [Pleurotus eryngii]
MGRIPPTLAYMTIYNPTLKLPDSQSDDDEDAEEQAHIVFYTSKERAVSRDRMLRQVGLAKALVNFSEMFNADEPCNNTHSQSRRMIMLSPEPNFWIHACVEVAKSTKPTPKAKGKEKDKPKAQEKGKDPPSFYEYDDSSVHDLALKADIQRGYERFKLIHGSFTTILERLGKEALELQLERFWTVWAWSWNLEDGCYFASHLGVPMHPLFRQIQPILDEMGGLSDDDPNILLIVPPHTVPSSKFMAAAYPSSLALHVLETITPIFERRLKPKDSKASLSASIDTIRGTKGPPDASKVDSSNTSTHPRNNSNTFLGMPTMNATMNKWNWPGYLTFGKSSNKRPPEVPKPPEDVPSAEKDTGDQVENVPPTEPSDDPQESAPKADSVQEDAAVDTVSLEEAVNAQLIPPTPPSEDSTSPSASDLPSDEVPSPEVNTPDQGEAFVQGASPEKEVDADSKDEEEIPRAPSLPLSPTPEPLPEYSFVHVNLPDKGGPESTTRQPVFYFTLQVCCRPFLRKEYNIGVAFVGLKCDANSGSSQPQLNDLAAELRPYFHKIQDMLEDELLRSAVDLLPSAAKILQPKDRYILSFNGYTVSSTGFASHSEHLFNGQRLQESPLDISEAFARGQNPQHWHVARRGIGFGSGVNNINGAVVTTGEAYFEVFRKETSLTDVDNALMGIVRKVLE